MKSYFEIKIPLDVNSEWLKGLKETLSDIDVRWQNGFQHITAVFIVNTPDKPLVSSIIDRHLINQKCLFELSFDQLDAFTIKDGHTHIIHLSSTETQTEFYLWLDGLRSELSSSGVEIEPDFKLHVTLGRVPSSSIGLDDLKSRVTCYKIPLLRFNTKCFEYREFRGETIKKWDF